MKDWQRIEAVLFGSGRYLTEEQIIQMSGVPKNKLKSALTELKNHYEHINSSLDIFKENNSWKLNVKEEFSNIAKNVISEAEMSKPVMETLALIAYKTPVFQSEIIDMKGAGAYDYISLLEEKGFITKEKSGRTFKVKITPKFYEYFDISGDSKLRQMFKGVKKPDAMGTLEVYNSNGATKTDEQKKDEEFSDKILERMKKVETTPFDHDEKKKFLDGFENKFSKTKSDIDETDKEMNEFRRAAPPQAEGQEGEGAKQEESSTNKSAERKSNDPDRNTARNEESEEEREESEKSESGSDSEDNFSENALKKLEKALEGLDSLKSKEDSEEEEETEQEEGEESLEEKEKETEEEKKPALPKKEIPEKVPEQSRASPDKLQKIKDEEIKKINKKVHAKEEKEEKHESKKELKNPIHSKHKPEEKKKRK